MFRRGRHFEFFIGVFQFICSFLYNFADALDVRVFLDAEHWHELTNVLSVTYITFLFIFLMANGNENYDNILRYLAFAFVWGLVCLCGVAGELECLACQPAQPWRHSG